MRNKPASVAILFLTAMIWGFAFTAQVVGGKIGIFYFNGIRYLLGGFALIPVILLFEKNVKNGRTSLFAGIAAGIIMFVASNLQQWGLNITESPGKGGFLTALYTVFVPVIARIFLKKKTSKNSYLGAFIALAGLFMILSGNMSSNEAPFFDTAINFSLFGKTHEIGFSMGFGDVVLILCGLAFAFHIVFIDYFNPKISPVRFSSAQFITCGVISLIIALFTESISFEDLKNTALVPILYSGLMSTAVAYTLQIIGQRGVHPTVSAIILSTESMFAALGGALLLHERLTAIAYAGCAVMMAGIFIANIPSKKKT